MMRTLVVGSMMAIFAVSAACGAELVAPTGDQEGIEFFEKNIRPVLVEKCEKCHAGESAAKNRGGLRVDFREALLKGGESGAAIVPGKPDESLLIDAIQYNSFEMPPSGKLPANVVADFVRWIEMGAPDPRIKPQTVEAGPNVASTIGVEEGRKFWSFQPLHEAVVPATHDAKWPLSDIDRFLLSKMEGAGVQPVAEASRTVLLRRITFDLTGLPPSIDELKAFETDPADDDTAIASVVDRLLSSPHFGERWGRHWLDVARFSESTGGGRSLLYGEAWRYRDYVFNAINDDLPFDRFIVEQIAGDLIPKDQIDGRSEPALIGTGFLALGPTNYELQDKVQLRMDVIDEQIDTVGRAFLGMTLGCARCHDHKFDPIPQNDYYALAGILGSTKTFDDGNVASWITRPLPPTPAQVLAVAEHQQLLANAERVLKEIETELKQREDVLVSANAVVGAEALVEGTIVDDDAAELVGEWTESDKIGGYFGKGYRHSTDPEATATFRQELEPGRYEVIVHYTPNSNRSPNALVVIKHQSDESTQRIDQRATVLRRKQGASLGTYEFDKRAEVVIATAGATGVVIADAVRFVRQDNPKANKSPKNNVAATSSPTDDDNVSGKSSGTDKAAEKEEAIIARLLKEKQTATANLTQIKKAAPSLPMTLSVNELPQPKGEPICIRGNARNLGDPVPRGVLQVATIGEPPVMPESQSGRLELAQWIASTENPLTSRVIVNRVWGHLFGEGIVRTVDNFGSPGDRPSHPELLDHLATTFMQDGWSMKQLIRRIVLSRAYRLSSQPTEQILKADPDNRLFSHQRRRRLEAEAIYDAMLSLSGELTLEFGGETVRPKTSSEYGYRFDHGRRAVYLPVFRNELPELFKLFDFPNPNASQGRRDVTTLATQALYLMNDPFVIERASAGAQRLIKAEPEAALRLDDLYLSALGRLPTPREREIALGYIAAAMEESPTLEQSAWTDVVQSILASVDFRQVE